MIDHGKILHDFSYQIAFIHGKGKVINREKIRKGKFTMIILEYYYHESFDNFQSFKKNQSYLASSMLKIKDIELCYQSKNRLRISLVGNSDWK